MYYDKQGKQITRDILIKSLNRLGDLLQQNKVRIDLVCCGGAVSVLYHKSRGMTHDVDALFPKNIKHSELLNSLIDQVGEEFNLEQGPRDKWFNNGVSFIGLNTASETVIFNHPFLVLRAAEWAEMLAHKISAFRGERDINDAVHYLKEIEDDNRERVYQQVVQYKPFVPTISDNIFYERFKEIWKLAYGRY